MSHQLRRVFWLDGGRIVRDGPTHEVVSAYEAAITSGEWLQKQRPDAPKVKARFLKWEIVEPRGDQPNVLTDLGLVTIRFLVQVNEPIRFGLHGIALFNNEGQLMWGREANNLFLDVGVHELHYTFPMLPLRPGAYAWLVSLYDSGSLADVWYGVPEMIVAVPSYQHSLDHWSGFLNLPCQFHVHHHRRSPDEKDLGF